jgi:hypothetical protein
MLLAGLLHLALFCPAQNDELINDTVITMSPPPPIEEVESPFAHTPQLQPVALRKVAQAKVDELKRDEAYWYANLEPKKKKKAEAQQEEREKGLLDASWFRNLLWIIILCSFIGVVIWYLASSNIRLFHRDSKKIMEEEKEEELSDDIFAINYEREIQKAADAKNYRLAIRLWYLKTLKELSDRNIIDYRHEKTDSEYVNSLYGTRYYRDFFRLTRNFEYTWYGQFHLSAEAYDLMRADFTAFKNSLS